MSTNLQTHAWNTIEFSVGALVFESILDPRDIANSDETRSTFEHHDVPEVLNPGHFPLCLYSVFGPSTFVVHATARNLRVFPTDRVDDIFDGHTKTSQLRRVQPDPDLPFSPSDDLDATDARHALQPLLDIVLGVGRQLADRERTGKHDGQYRLGVGIRLTDKG